MMIRETIHHGAYRNVRLAELPDVPSPYDLGRLLEGCPYGNSPHLDPSRLGLALYKGQSFTHGWVTWERVES